MNTINRQPNQIDEINYNLDLNREERELLFSHYMMIHMLILNSVIITEQDLKLLKVNSDYLVETIKENNRETELYEDMCAYLEWMMSNNLYDYYLHSPKREEFEYILSELTASSVIRNLRTLNVITLIKNGLKYGPENVTMYGDEEVYTPYLSDEKLNELKELIPKKKH